MRNAIKFLYSCILYHLFEGVQQLNQIYFFVIVFESQKLPHLKGKWGGERKEGVWKADGRVWKGRRR